MIMPFTRHFVDDLVRDGVISFPQSSVIEWQTEREPREWQSLGTIDSHRIFPITETYTFTTRGPITYTQGQPPVRQIEAQPAVRTKTIYLWDNGDGGVCGIAVGFRQEDREAITSFLNGEDSGLALDLDSAEVEVRWIGGR